MSVSLQGETTAVTRLRVHYSGKDPFLVQQRIARLLKAARLHPSTLPPSAILIIRKVRAPAPGSLQLDRFPTFASPDWERAVTSLLDRLATSAVHPALGAVPPSAEAVVFLDRSELLACLATDWCEGRLMSRWWWQSLLKQGAGMQIVKELWRRDPQYVPAALQQLAAKNKARDFVRALSDVEAGELLRGVAQTFALPALVRVLDNLETSTNTDWDSLPLNQPKAAARRGKELGTMTAPWRPWVNECLGAELSPEQEFFFGVALMLQRAPVKARAPEFHASLRAWQQHVSSAHTDQSGIFVEQTETSKQALRGSANLDQQSPHLAESHSSERARSRAQLDQAANSRGNANREPIGADSASAVVSEPSTLFEANQIARQPLHVQSPDAEVRLQVSHSNGESAASLPDPITKSATTAKTNELAAGSIERGIVSPESSSSLSAPGAILEVAGAAAPAASAELLPVRDDETSAQFSAIATAETEQVAEWIETGFGGVFYLINLGLALGFYGDFTTPDEPGIQLDIWDFVALLSCELVGDDVKADPVWPLLQQLAQREEGELLGSGFDPDTVKSFEFQVSSSAFDEEVSGEPETRNSKLKTRNAELKTQNPKLETNPAVAAWIDRLMPHVRARLRQALGRGEQDDPGPLVCRQRARVCVTPTHLDVFFFLADLPIEIRYAGLDRNPGWVPAAGKFIAFHFE